MTAHKHFKQLVRARMQKTGESYATARRQVLRAAPQPASDPATRWHFAGNVPATTALRVLLAHAGVRAPHTGEPFSEALLFGIAGGIGAGMFSFVYEAADFASFFIAGRHLWQDDVAYLQAACTRCGLTPTLRESAGTKAAEGSLIDTLAEGPCIAWVDLAHLPHRAMPVWCSGGGYHVVTVYRADADSALIGDLADEPIAIRRADLTQARARIKKQKHRLLSVPPAKESPDLVPLVGEGLRHCHEGLTGAKAKMKNFTLDAFRVWAARMQPGSKDKESWERLFTPGKRFWNGLAAIYTFIEHYGTGGGLCRPLFADFLAEAAEALGKPSLRSLAQRYAELGRGWSELAEAALPGDVPELRQAKELHAQKVELTHSGAATATEAVRDCWKQLSDLEQSIRTSFPLSDSACAELRAQLHGRIQVLYEGEQAACAALAEACQDL
jgi:hypothetical protein